MCRFIVTVADVALYSVKYAQSRRLWWVFPHGLCDPLWLWIKIPISQNIGGSCGEIMLVCRSALCILCPFGITSDKNQPPSSSLTVWHFWVAVCASSPYRELSKPTSGKSGKLHQIAMENPDCFDVWHCLTRKSQVAWEGTLIICGILEPWLKLMRLPDLHSTVVAVGRLSAMSPNDWCSAANLAEFTQKQKRKRSKAQKTVSSISKQQNHMNHYIFGF